MDKYKLIAIIAAIIVILLIIVLTSRDRIYRTYLKYRTIGNKENITGKQLAGYAKQALNLDQLTFTLTDTKLGDAYSPKFKCLILSNEVCNMASLSSLTIVAHELGHACQDKESTPLFILSQFLRRITNFTNKFIMPLLIAGILMFLFKYPTETIGSTLMIISGVLFVLHVVNLIITIPLEYNASSRGLKFLKENNFVSLSELKKAKKLLSIAAQTYIAGLFDSILILNTKRKRK